jgi:hypothetical protein
MTTPPHTDAPTPEAMEAARRACGAGGMQITTTDFVVAIALALDRFRAAGVREEQERIANMVSQIPYSASLSEKIGNLYYKDGLMLLADFIRNNGESP